MPQLREQIRSDFLPELIKQQGHTEFRFLFQSSLFSYFPGSDIATGDFYTKESGNHKFGNVEIATFESAEQVCESVARSRPAISTEHATCGTA